MKAEFISNGVVKIILIPENELDKLALEMVSKGEVETTLIQSQTSILEKIFHEGLVLQPKKAKTT